MPHTDLTGYAALLGESLSSRVDLLERLIDNAHYPSLGQYKERLLVDAIKDFLPRTVEVGTGFVLFPHADAHPPGDLELYDPLNQSAYSVSRQCDILIYDVARFPPVFRDRDFVVVRPEAVRAVIEVKGSLSRRETANTLSSFHDFATKWRDTQLFYLAQGVPLTDTPSLFIMAWRIASDSVGRPLITPTSIRKLIAKFYAKNVEASQADGYPFLEQLFIHNEADIIKVVGIEQTETVFIDSFGWASHDGRFVRIARDGTLFRDKDRTVAALLASLHWAIAERDFNRFFSYQDEVRDKHALPYDHAGTSWAWRDITDISVLTARRPFRRET